MQTTKCPMMAPQSSKDEEGPSSFRDLGEAACGSRNPSVGGRKLSYVKAVELPRASRPAAGGAQSGTQARWIPQAALPPGCVPAVRRGAGPTGRHAKYSLNMDAMES